MSPLSLAKLTTLVLLVTLAYPTVVAHPGTGAGQDGKVPECQSGDPSMYDPYHGGLCTIGGLPVIIEVFPCPGMRWVEEGEPCPIDLPLPVPTREANVYLHYDCILKGKISFSWQYWALGPDGTPSRDGVEEERLCESKGGSFAAAAPRNPSEYADCIVSPNLFFQWEDWIWDEIPSELCASLGGSQAVVAAEMSPASGTASLG